jgi:hypothetical protein
LIFNFVDNSHTVNMMLPLLAISAVVSLGAAQTYTSCNPTNSKPDLDSQYLTELTRLATCDPDTGLKKWSLSTDFTQGSSDEWTAISGNVTYGSNGAEFTINERYDAPTLETNFYIFFGEVEVVMRAANGTGIVSSIVMESDDLDEIDWVSTLPVQYQRDTDYDRNALEPTPPRSKPTTSAKATRPHTTGPSGRLSARPRTNSTRTKLSGRLRPSPGTLTGRPCAHSSMPMPSTGRTSLKPLWL